LSDDVGSRERLVGLLFLYGFWVVLGAESLQGGNKMSVVGVLRIVSCIIYNEKLTDANVDLDHSPSACVGHDAWRSEGLPQLPSAVVINKWLEWDAVLKHLRQVCIRLLRLLLHGLQFPIFPSPRQVIRKKYERLLSAAPSATLDCSGLFDGKRAMEVIERAVSQHAGGALTQSLPFVYLCCLCTSLLSCSA
jgi:hypothetical protein